jgi:hypothetical protein
MRLFLLILMILWPAPGGRGEQALPQGPGMAARYPGDGGIAKDPAVLFAEDFEEGSLEAVGKRWDEVSNKDGKVLALSDDVPPASSGKRSVQMAGTLGENSGGHLYARFPGVDKAFLRFYVKFAPDHAYEHHFVWLGGHNPPTRWPWPRAGTCPRGDERISVGIEPIGWYGRYPPPGAWVFYNYWHEMKISADRKYWGNGVSLADPPLVPRDRWQCVEIMLKMNSAPGQPDGELALWLDGQLVMQVVKGVRRGPWSGMGFQVLQQGGEPFEGFPWRTNDALRINYLWLEHYVDEGAQRQNKLANPTRVNRVWFDDVVVAKSYIGPLVKNVPSGAP